MKWNPRRRPTCLDVFRFCEDTDLRCEIKTSNTKTNCDYRLHFDVESVIPVAGETQVSNVQNLDINSSSIQLNRVNNSTIVRSSKPESNPVAESTNTSHTLAEQRPRSLQRHFSKSEKTESLEEVILN